MKSQHFVFLRKMLEPNMKPRKFLLFHSVELHRRRSTYQHRLTYQPSLTFSSRVRFSNGGCLSKSEGRVVEGSLRSIFPLLITFPHPHIPRLIIIYLSRGIYFLVRSLQFNSITHKNGLSKSLRITSPCIFSNKTN